MYTFYIYYLIYSIICGNTGRVIVTNELFWLLIYKLSPDGYMTALHHVPRACLGQRKINPLLPPRLLFGVHMPSEWAATLLLGNRA